jgi:hypothetical protein
MVQLLAPREAFSPKVSILKKATVPITLLSFSFVATVELQMLFPEEKVALSFRIWTSQDYSVLKTLHDFDFTTYIFYPCLGYLFSRDAKQLQGYNYSATFHSVNVLALSTEGSLVLLGIVDFG